MCVCRSFIHYQMHTVCSIPTRCDRNIPSHYGSVVPRNIIFLYFYFLISHTLLLASGEKFYTKETATYMYIFYADGR